MPRKRKAKKMAKNNLHHGSGNNMWFGFVLGTVLGGGGLYLFGTKKGREFLKKAIDTVEDLELTAADVLEEIEEVVEEGIDRQADSVSENIQNVSNLDSVLNKIQHVLPTRKKVKKYFSKEGQIQKSS